MTIPLSPTTESFMKNKTHRWASCWELERVDGVFHRWTDHDQNIVTLGQTFLAQDSLIVSARQAKGGFQSRNYNVAGPITATAIPAEDLIAGLYRDAKLTEYVINWQYQWVSPIITTKGWIETTSFNGETWQAEIGGIASKLRRPVGERYTKNCRYELGDPQCKVVLAVDGGTVSSIVTASTKFIANGIIAQDPHTLNGVSVPFYAFGKLLWTSGLNDGLIFNIKTYDNSTDEFELQEPTPFAIQASDGFNVTPGCNKSRASCFTKFDNLDNYGGFPHIPGVDKSLQTPKPSGINSIVGGIVNNVLELIS